MRNHPGGPHLGPFSFDVHRGRHVARAKRWVTWAERELTTARARKAVQEIISPTKPSLPRAQPEAEGSLRLLFARGAKFRGIPIELGLSCPRFLWPGGDSAIA